jgi:hypothetical protein
MLDALLQGTTEPAVRASLAKGKLLFFTEITP